MAENKVYFYSNQIPSATYNQCTCVPLTHEGIKTLKTAFLGSKCKKIESSFQRDITIPYSKLVWYIFGSIYSTTTLILLFLLITVMAAGKMIYWSTLRFPYA